MRDIATDLMGWYESGRPFALARVQSTSGSAPREVGAAMAVDADGAVLGSVSGGCVEGEVYERCRQILTTGGCVVEEFGDIDEDAFAVGLPCGGGIAVRISRVDPATDTGFGAELRAELGRAPARLLVFGAVDFAAALARIGRALGWYVVVCDARGVFTTRQRFPDADEVVVQWPHRYLEQATVDEHTAIVTLTHDAKFDVPLLSTALRGRAGYVGAMGSRRTQADRAARLHRAGLGEAELARLHAPVGLDLGARSSSETALSILAEIVARFRGGAGRPLSELSGPIHHDPVREERSDGVRVPERRRDGRRSAA